jgi:GT2 family glycosyltransferase
MSELTVSVVIPTFNGRAHVATLLDALAQQTFPRDEREIVIVDNGSDDGTPEFLREHPTHVRLVENERNVGFAAACNQGAAESRGRYLALLNNDMRPEPRWLAQVVERFRSAPPSVACIASRIENWDGSRVDFAGGGVSFNGIGQQDGYGVPVGSEHDRDPPTRLLFACGGAMLIDRRIFLDVGGFDDRFFAFFEDVDLGWRLWVLGYEVWSCPGAVVYHRGGATGGAIPAYRKLALLERNALYTALKNYEDTTLATVLPAALLLIVKRVTVRAGVPREVFAVVPAGPAVPRAPNDLFRERVATVKALLRNQGIRGVFGRALVRAGHAVLPEGKDERPRSWIPLDAYAGLVAVEDLLDELPRLLESRSWIQERRRRSDAEIFRLFPPRFVPESEHPDYIATYNAVVDAMHVDAAVASESAPVPSPGTASCTQTT